MVEEDEINREVEFGGMIGAATPAVCEPRPSFCSVNASSFPVGVKRCVVWKFRIASTVASSHLPLGVPVNEPSLLSALWISEIRSGVGACCPRSLWRDFFDFAEDLRVLLLLVEDFGDVLLAAPVAARLSHTPSDAATSSARPRYMAPRRYIRALSSLADLGTKVRRKRKQLLLAIGRHNARQKHRQGVIIVATAQNLEHHILPWLQFGHSLLVVLDGRDGLVIDLRDHVAAPES